MNATLQERPAQRMPLVETMKVVKVAKVERVKDRELLHSLLLDSPFSLLSSSEINGPPESAEDHLVLRTDKLHLPALTLSEGS